MVKVSQLKKIIDSDFKGGVSSVTLLLRFLSKPEEKDLSRWFVITKEAFGFVKFEKRPGVFDEDNCQLKLC